jgi:hypothetical protein
VFARSVFSSFTATTIPSEPIKLHSKYCFTNVLFAFEFILLELQFSNTMGNLLSKAQSYNAFFQLPSPPKSRTNL